MKRERGHILLVVTAALAILAVGIGGFLWWRSSTQTSQKACTLEAKICPDGSTVGRSGPKCEFATCPTAADEMANWKTYTNNKFGFSFKYPTILDFKSCPDILCGTFTNNITKKDVIRLDGISSACASVKNEASITNAETAVMCGCLADGPGVHISCESPSDEEVSVSQNGIEIFSFSLNELKNGVLNRKRVVRSVFFPKPVLSGGLLYEYGLYFDTLNNSGDSGTNQILSTFRFL